MKKATPTHEIARERLRAVLETDRGHLTGKPLELFRKDLAAVLLSYMDVEEDKLSVRFERTEQGAANVYIEAADVRVRRLATRMDSDIVD